VSGTLPVAPLGQDRVRSLRWAARDVELPEVIEQLRRLQSELAERDAGLGVHPHPRNSCLNLVVVLGEHQGAQVCDRLIANLGPSHPLRAILLDLDDGRGRAALDAEITADAHLLFRGFPVQRVQVLLGVRGAATAHLASLVDPLLAPDVPTYLWWCAPEPPRGAVLDEALRFSDVLVVDSASFARPAELLLELAALVRRPEVGIGIAEFQWGRLRPWRDAIGQFFAPADRRSFLFGLVEVSAESAGDGPASRVGAALLAGWAAAALGWRFVDARPAGAGATEVAAETPAGRRVTLALRSVTRAGLAAGELVGVRITGRSGRRHCSLVIERDVDGGHAQVSIDLDDTPTIHQRLTLPRQGDPDLLFHVLLAGRHDPVFERSLLAVTDLLEAMR
jgi:glucose-6-phosphate dehydrogenase assembly protein OpcA